MDSKIGSKKPSFLVIIPARGGSKRLPRKNILSLGGKPLIAWSIEASNNSKYISKTVVSSDDEEILNIAQNYNSETIKRPPYLATDTATSYDAIEHTILSQNEHFDYIVLLQPTSPLRTQKHIDEAIEMLLEKKGDAIISMSEVEHPIQWCTPLEENFKLDTFICNINTQRSQEQKKHFRLNGAIYIAKTEKLLEQKTFFLDKNSYSYVMEKINSIDIDDELDFLTAETILKHNKI